MESEAHGVENEAAGKPAEQYSTRDQMRAIAHPIRMSILSALARTDHARAADLAADLGLPANTVSYHLRILARGGAIEEAPEHRRDKRDRVWRSVRSTLQGNDPKVEDPDYIEASFTMALSALDWVKEAWLAEAGTALGSGDSPRTFNSLINTDTRLSESQARECWSELEAVIRKYEKLNRSDSGIDMPGDPDSADEARTFLVSASIVRPPHRTS